MLSSKKGYGAINTILSTSGLEVSSCYLAARGQHYHYISCLALLTLLESKDSPIICLARKEVTPGDAGGRTPWRWWAEAGPSWRLAFISSSAG